LDVTAGALITRGWVEAGIKDLDTAAGQMPAVREIIGCESDEDVLRLIQDPSFIARFAEQYSETGPANGAAGLEKQVVIDIGENPQLSGYLNRTLADIAEQEGKSVVETLLDLGVKSALALQMKSAPVGATQPDQGLKLMANAGVSLGVSDGGAHTNAFGFGHYATELLIWLVRQHRHVTLEEMHYQLSLKPAQAMCLRDRGALLLGYAADILVYDLEALYVDDSRMEIVHDMPDGDWRRRIRAGGYDWTLVNGVVTHRNDGSTGDTPGKLLRITRNLPSDIPIAAE
jgi:N-acyl-D-aspartate/D-glutamate deacylase